MTCIQSQRFSLPRSITALAADSRFARLPPRSARVAAVALTALFVAGVIAGHNLGRIVERSPSEASDGLNGRPAADLILYQTIVAEVRNGKNYYDAAYQRLPEFGFPVGSMFNWRLPTYAWFGSLSPSDNWIQGVIAVLALAALLLAFAAERENLGFIRSALLIVLLVGVLRWCIDGLAFYTMEVWAATFLTISVSAMAVRDRLNGSTTGQASSGTRQDDGTAGQASSGTRMKGLAWTGLSVGTGLAALFFRELTLPYCVAACGVAFWHRRRGEGCAWLAGIALFVLFLAWHGSQVAARLTLAEATSSRGPLEWMQVGGMHFVLMTTRMNTFVYNAPGWLLFSYLFFSLLGLADAPRRHCELLGAATILFVGAFCIVGMDMNFYWGLLYAPFLPFGLVRAPQAVHGLLIRAYATPSLR